MEAKNPVRSVERTIEILETIRELNGATLSELTNQLNLSKGAIHNHVSTLNANGYIVKANQNYQLGIKFFEFGAGIRNEKPIYKIGVPEVDKLARETGELANILIEEQGMGIYLHRAQGDDALSLDTGAGSRVHMHNTALGKSILAHLPESEVNDILEQKGMPATTDRTITNKLELLDQLHDIQDRGYAFDMGERADGIRCVAAPVITSDQTVHGSISIAGPKGRMNGEYLRQTIPDLVTSAANVISINLTYA